MGKRLCDRLAPQPSDLRRLLSEYSALDQRGYTEAETILSWIAPRTFCYPLWLKPAAGFACLSAFTGAILSTSEFS
jgi:hypothetical protein